MRAKMFKDMADRPAPPVFLEPEEHIALWSIREFHMQGESNTSRHLIGLVPRKMTLRVTSPIKAFDRNTLQVITSSGRLYHLVGLPEFSEFIEFSLKIWMTNNNVIHQNDVTAEYIRIH